jgi:hypothetical protein
MKTFPALKGIHPTVCMNWGIFGLGNPSGDEAALQWVLQRCIQGGSGCDVSWVKTGSGTGIRAETGTATGSGIVTGSGKGTGSGRRTGSETRAGEEEGEGEGKGTESGRSKERGTSAGEREKGVTGPEGEGERGGEGGRKSGVVVYGSGLSAIAAISGLIKNNVPTHLLTLIIPEEELEELGHPTVCPVATVSWT